MILSEITFYKVKIRMSEYIIENIKSFVIKFYTKTITKKKSIHFKVFVMNRKPRCTVWEPLV